MHILRFFAYVYDYQMMPSKFKLIVYYDISYTSPFLVKIGSLVVCFHPSLNITPLVLWILFTKSLWNNKKKKCNHYIASCVTNCSTTTSIFSFCTKIYGCAPTSDSINFTSSSIDLFCGFIFNGFICGCSTFVIGMVFIYSCF